jgi:hypothetical protein
MEDGGLVLLSIHSARPSGDLIGRLPECFRGPSHGRTGAPSTQGRARCVSEGTAPAGGRSGRLRRLDGPFFRWDEDRRFLIRAELDAALFHLYLPADANGDWIPARQADGCPYDETPEQLEELKKSFPKPRDAVSYIMDTFPIVQRKDIQKHGDYRTKLQILEIYDRMAEAMKTGVPYQTLLEPPPGDPKCCHPTSAGKIH